MPYGLLTTAFADAQQAAPHALSGAPFSDALVRMGVALGILVVVLGVVRVWLPRLLGRTRPWRVPGSEDSSVLSLEASLRLSAAQSLSLVRCGAQRFLVSASPAGATLLAEVRAEPVSRESHADLIALGTTAPIRLEVPDRRTDGEIDFLALIDRARPATTADRNSTQVGVLR